MHSPLSPRQVLAFALHIVDNYKSPTGRSSAAYPEFAGWGPVWSLPYSGFRLSSADPKRKVRKLIKPKTTAKALSTKTLLIESSISLMITRKSDKVDTAKICRNYLQKLINFTVLRFCLSIVLRIFQDIVTVFYVGSDEWYFRYPLPSLGTPHPFSNTWRAWRKNLAKIFSYQSLLHV